MRLMGKLNGEARVSVWLTLSKDVPMPEIAFGNQFGYQTCDVKDAECAAWTARQRAYRARLRRLFVRHWVLTPASAQETYAAAAIRESRDPERDVLRMLESKNAPNMSVSDDGYQVTIPWSALPPAPDLELKTVYFAVSTADEPPAYSEFVLPSPRVSRITSCEHALEGTDPYGNAVPGWYLPSGSPMMPDYFVLANDAAGYRYKPEGLSPRPQWTHAFELQLAKTQVVCGPDLAYRAGTEIWSIDGDAQLNELTSRALPNGDAPHEADWTFDRYCLSGDAYQPCGSGKVDALPQPRQAPELK